MNSVNNDIPFVPENTIDPAAGLNESINVIDALLQLSVVSVGTNVPPGTPAVGSRYIVGVSPTGAWAGRANQVARWLDGAWQFFTARYALNLTDGAMWVRQSSGWLPLEGGGVETVAGVSPDGSGNVPTASLVAALGVDDKVDKVAGKGLSANDFTDAERSKLDGIAAGATANATDAHLLNRANHTGTQAISTVTGLQNELDGINAAMGDVAAALDAINGEVI